MTKKQKIILSIIYIFTFLTFALCLVMSIIYKDYYGITGFICAIIWEVNSFVLLKVRNHEAQVHKTL